MRVYYWPRYDALLVEGYDTLCGRMAFECQPIVVKTSKKYVWTILPLDFEELIDIGEL